VTVPAQAMPLLLFDTGAGWALRAPCGAETAVLFTGTADPAAPVARAARTLAVRNSSLRPDASPTAVLQLALHCTRCTRCQTRRTELLTLMSQERPVLT
jgi:hypothetical protein